MRLVDADEFKAANGMKDDCADCDKELKGKSKACEFDRVYTKMDFCGWIDDAPTVDAVPVEHGKWEKHKGIFICSRCLTGYKEQPTMMGKPLFEFCPVCGADMRKDGDDGKAD